MSYDDKPKEVVIRICKYNIVHANRFHLFQAAVDLYADRHFTARGILSKDRKYRTDAK